MPDDREDFEQAWARIVEDLTSESTPGATTDADGGPARPAEQSPDPEAGLTALFEPLRRARADQGAGPSDAADDPGAFVDNWQDEGHFVPPPPPEIPEGTPLKRLAWAGLLGGPATLALIVLTGWDAPRLIGVGAGLVTLAGFATLVWLLPDSREDSGWDDGARI